MDVIDITSIGPFGEPLPVYPIPKSQPQPQPQQQHDSPPIIYSNKDCNENNLKKQSLLFFSAGITAAFTSSLYNSLDCLRVRWQVSNATNHIQHPQPQPQPQQYNTIQFASRIIQTEGFINGLWRPGIVANGIGMGLSGALRFGCYEIVRDALCAAHPMGQQEEGTAGSPSKNNNNNNKNGIQMALAGLSCGAFAYFITTPFHLIKTMIQAERGRIGPDGLYCDGPRAGKKPYVTGLVSGMQQIVKDQGIVGLWRGCIPLTARGATFTGGQLVGYDGFKTICKSHDVLEDGPLLHAIAGVVAAACATLTATPADYTMSRYMASDEKSVSVVVRRIYQEGGIVGFWRGSTINFCRSTPVFLTYTAVYEQLRHYFGLGYFG
jgi:hypothetical protein